MKYSRKLITNNSGTSCLGKFFKVFLGGGIRETGKNNFRNRGIVYSWLHEVRAWRWAARQGLSQSARVNSQPNQFRRLRPDQFLIWRPLSTHKQAPPLDTLAPPTRGVVLRPFHFFYQIGRCWIRLLQFWFLFFLLRTTQSPLVARCSHPACLILSYLYPRRSPCRFALPLREANVCRKGATLSGLVSK